MKGLGLWFSGLKRSGDLGVTGLGLGFGGLGSRGDLGFWFWVLATLDSIGLGFRV